MTTQAGPRWNLQGEVIGGCNCSYGCPCSFNAPPTHGFCQGTYIGHIDQGTYGDTPLNGLHFSVSAHSPAAIHLGNLTIALAIDERANAKQREALTALLTGKGGGPIGVFANLSTKIIGPEFVAAEWRPDGLNSYARMGDRVEVHLDSIKNPVTGAESTYTLNLGAGLLTNQQEMCGTRVYRSNQGDVTHDHSGHFGTAFKFDWKGGE
jgi:hypothetical protein